MITGPGSPSVLSNMAVSIEQHVDWVVDRLAALREAGFTTMEATETAQAGWAQHMADCSTLTLHRLANTWYTAPTFPEGAGLMPKPAASALSQHLQRGRRPRQSASTHRARILPSNATMARWFACSRMCGWCSACWRRSACRKSNCWAPRGRRDFLTEFNKGRPGGRPVGEVGSGALQGAEGPCPIAFIGRRRRGRIRSWSISTAAAGCSATNNPTIRSAATFAAAAA